uniref:Proteasome assembly chaperone 2 n=2 Tax=Sinocyclocheilus grahami TaxID=75366 RepID=A0A672NUA7_SINGR
MFIASGDAVPCFKGFTLIMVSETVLVYQLHQDDTRCSNGCNITKSENFKGTKVRSFRKLMVSWIKSSGFLRSVLLSSSHAYHRDDQQLHGTPLRYLLTPSLQKEEAQRVEELGWREMERISAFPGISDSEQRLYIPGGGVTKALYTDCCTEDISMAVVLIFCSEGDNIPDAFALVNHLNDWLHLLEKPTQGSVQWRVPPSWRLLFGSGIPPLLF